MDIHRKLGVLEQRAKVDGGVLEQWANCVDGPARQLRDLEPRPKLRVLKQWADGRVRQRWILAHVTKLRVLKQQAKVRDLTQRRRRAGRVRQLRLLAQQPKVRVLK